MYHENYSSKRLGTRKIAIVGLLSAISIILGSTGYGFIPLPFAKATFLHIPVIIGAILEGPLVGALIGLIFGLFSVFQNMVAPTSILSFAFLNPLVSVLPRILIGLVAYYSYKAVHNIAAKRPESFKIGVSAFVGSLTNTVGVLGMIYILYVARYAEKKGMTVSAAAKAIWGIALTNGLAEALISVVITIPVVLAVKHIRR